MNTLLTGWNQEHIIEHLEIMTDTERRALLDDVREIDLQKIQSFLELYRSHKKQGNNKKYFEEAPVLSFDSSAASSREKKRLCSIGEDCLRDGKVAAFLVAGGQGTRLGFQGPKGCYKLSPVREKSLFQIFAETIRAIQKRYGAALQWFIMTSRANNYETTDFFEQNNYFNLKRDSIHFIIQKELPALDPNGRLIVSRDKKIFKNPNGHGGSISALHDSGALEKMRNLGIEEIFYFQVDNPLAKIADPLFVGAHIEHRAEMSTKVVKKTDPGEKVGIIGKVNGKLGCIEYSEMTQKEVHEKKKDGSLRFNSANIAIHMLNRRFVEKLNSQQNFKLPYHIAVKEIECLQVEKGRHIPEKMKGIKFETFIFDALGFAERSVTLEVKREEEFAPVKNKSGADSPETAQKAMIRIWTQWLGSSGNVSGVPDDLIIEVSPLYALDEIEFKKKFIPPENLSSPLYLG